MIACFINQGGIQSLEAMLYTIDWINNKDVIPGVKIGAYILDDCDKDTYGLEQAVDFIKGKFKYLIEYNYFDKYKRENVTVQKLHVCSHYCT